MHYCWAMSADAAPQMPSQADTSDRTAGRLGWARELLSKLRIAEWLADTGAKISEAISREMAAAAAALPAKDLSRRARLFEKVTRAIHMAIILQSRLIAELHGPKGERAGEAGAAPTPPIRRAAPRQASDEDRDLDQAERCETDAAERLLQADQRAMDRLWCHVMTRPVDELIAEIGRALGLGPGWLRQAEEELGLDPGSHPRPSHGEDAAAGDGGGEPPAPTRPFRPSGPPPPRPGEEGRHQITPSDLNFSSSA